MKGEHDWGVLMETVVSFAHKRLDEQGAFLPFFATVAANGDVNAGMGQTDDGQPEAIELKAQSERILKDLAKRNQIVAAALAVDVGISNGLKGYSTAIHVFLEHQVGIAVNAYWPYRASQGNDTYFGDPVFESAGPLFFI